MECDWDKTKRGKEMAAPVKGKLIGQHPTRQLKSLSGEQLREIK